MTAMIGHNLGLEMVNLAQKYDAHKTSLFVAKNDENKQHVDKLATLNQMLNIIRNFQAHPEAVHDDAERAKAIAAHEQLKNHFPDHSHLIGPDFLDFDENQMKAAQENLSEQVKVVMNAFAVIQMDLQGIMEDLKKGHEIFVEVIKENGKLIGIIIHRQVKSA